MFLQRALFLRFSDFEIYFQSSKMFMNFRISVTVIVSLLARSKAPKFSESATIDPPLVQLLLLQCALFSQNLWIHKIIFNPPKCL